MDGVMYNGQLYTSEDLMTWNKGDKSKQDIVSSSDSANPSSKTKRRSRSRSRSNSRDNDRKRHKHHRHRHHHRSRDDEHEHRSRESGRDDRDDNRESKKDREDLKDTTDRDSDRRRDHRESDRSERVRSERDHRDRSDKDRSERKHRDQSDRDRSERDHRDGPLMPSKHAIPPRQVVPVVTAAVTASVIEPLAPGYGQGYAATKSSSSTSHSKALGDDKIAKLFGYSADVNPFGDPNLTSQFVWKRKVEKDLATGKITREPTAEDLAKQRDEMMSEILRAKERRRKAEAEEEERDRLRSEEARLRNSSEYAEWDKKEEDFHLKQIRDRSLIRIRDKREHHVDAFAKNSVVMNACAAGRDDEEEFLRLEVQIRNPLVTLRGISKSALLSPPLSTSSSSSFSSSSSRNQVGPTNALVLLEKLKAELREFIELERGIGPIADYFRHCCIVCEDEERRIRSFVRGLEAGQSAANVEAVEEEIQAMFLGKSDKQLEELENQVKSLLEQSRLRGNQIVGTARLSGEFQHLQSISAGGTIDSDYWESVLKSLLAARSTTAIKKMHEEQLLARLDQIEKRAEIRKRAHMNKVKTVGLPVQKQELSSTQKQSTVLSKEDIVEEEEEEEEEYGSHKIPSTTSNVVTSASVDIAADARAVAIQKRISDLQNQGIITRSRLEDDDRDGGDKAGQQGAGRHADQLLDDVDVAAFIDEAGRTLPTGFFESSLDATAEIGLPSSSSTTTTTTELSGSTSELIEKYRPRKPRFFNRVKSGYDWNRYNSAHYDRDNPPPKTVQGYKFTIFYPDLIDRFKTPSFKLEPAASPEFVIIRFKSGPPYEDIAFQIVNKEWDTGRMSGYRCTYDRGILQLFFNFKRARYRK